MQGPELPQRAGSATVAARAPSSHPDPVQGHNSQVPAAGLSSDWVCCSPIFFSSPSEKRAGAGAGYTQLAHIRTHANAIQGSKTRPRGPTSVAGSRRHFLCPS